MKRWREQEEEENEEKRRRKGGERKKEVNYIYIESLNQNVTDSIHFDSPKLKMNFL